MNPRSRVRLYATLLAAFPLVFAACTGGPTAGTGSPFYPPPSSPVPTNTPAATATKTQTPIPSATPSPTKTLTPNATATPTASRTATSTPSATPTVTLTPTPSRTATATATPTLTSTPSPPPTCVVAGGNFAAVGVANNSSTTNDWGTYVVGPFGLSNASAVTALTFAAPTLSNQSMYAGIYADNGSGYPGALVYQSPQTTITAGGGSLIPVVVLSSAPLTLCPGNYWLAISSIDTTTHSILFYGQNSQTAYCDFSGVMPDPFPSTASNSVSVAMQMYFQY